MILRGEDRFTTTSPGATTQHSFSFGHHYDPSNVRFGPLVAHNDDRLECGAGYDPHPHADLEILTWVVGGSLTHDDSHGHHAVVGTGQVQRLAAGSGVRHSEIASAATRFVQMWLTPDEPGLLPVHEIAPVDVHGLTAVASGIPGLDAAVRLGVAGAALHVARPAPGEQVALPDAARLHVFVTRGSVSLGDDVLRDGDAARCTGEVGVVVTGGEAAEVLVWQLP
ncbi:MAG: pirin family protein [Nocardioidaceae bacterium]